MRSSRGNSQAGSSGSSYSQIPLTAVEVVISDWVRDLPDWVRPTNLCSLLQGKHIQMQRCKFGQFKLSDGARLIT